MRAPACKSASLALIPLLLAAAAPASADDDEEPAQLKIDYSGQIQTDLRFRTNTVSIGDYYNRVSLPAGVERNQNMLRMKLKANYGRFTGAADVDFVINGFTGKLEGLGDLSAVEKVQPYRFDVNSLYIEAKDLIKKGLDLRVGQQTVLWGVADQFNPTNNLNPDDLRDPLLFGKQAGNFMVKLDYWISEDWSLSGVLVPVFKPALLPNSAALGIAAIDRLPFTDPFIRHRIEAESGFAASDDVRKPTVANTITPVLPDTTFGNMQFAYRIAGTIADQDIALSYYNGRTDFPQPFLNHSYIGPKPATSCDPLIPNRCVDGLLDTDVSLGFPRMHVYGLNLNGEIPMTWLSKALRGIGYRLEGALIVPEEAKLQLTQETLDLGGITKPKGEYDYPGGVRPNVVDRTPFLKWTLGFDYAFGSHVYTNVQWVHGLADEFGAGDFIHQGYAVRESGITTTGMQTLTQCVLPSDGTKCAREVLRHRLGDYLVLGVDLKFLNDSALMRLFAVIDLTGISIDSFDKTQNKRVQVDYSPFSKEAFSASIYPDFNYNFGNGLELGAGALIELGKSYTKFGDPAAGGSMVFTHGRFSF